MLSQPVPSSSLSTSIPSTSTAQSPASPTRSGRLRGLSYIRNYTNIHLLSRDNSNASAAAAAVTTPTTVTTATDGDSTRPSTISRTSSYPPQIFTTFRRQSTDPPIRAGLSPNRNTLPGTSRFGAESRAAVVQGHEATAPATSGWLPTVGGQSIASRLLSEPQSFSTPSSAAVLSGNPNPSAGSDNLFVTAMGRTRSATTSCAGPLGDSTFPSSSSPSAAAVAAAAGQPVRSDTMARIAAISNAPPPKPAAGAESLPSLRFTAHQDLHGTAHRAARPSLVFSPMSRVLPTGGEVIRVGRYSERESSSPLQSSNVPSAAPIGFKSKVVSRRHCEFWCQAGQWYIRDMKSSSGTFLNHIRLSPPGTESRPFPVNDGDIVQLGIDFKGGEEMIFRCVKIRVEVNRGWQNALNTFNMASHKRLRDLTKESSKRGSSTSQDCSICLVPPRQTLFVAPCSHTWHYKCIRPMLTDARYPHFICPNCRAVADLEAEVDDPSADGEWESIEAEDVSALSADANNANTNAEDPSPLPAQALSTTDADEPDGPDHSSEQQQQQQQQQQQPPPTARLRNPANLSANRHTVLNPTPDAMRHESEAEQERQRQRQLERREARGRQYSADDEGSRVDPRISRVVEELDLFSLERALGAAPTADPATPAAAAAAAGTAAATANTTANTTSPARNRALAIHPVRHHDGRNRTPSPGMTGATAAAVDRGHNASGDVPSGNSNGKNGKPGSGSGSGSGSNSSSSNGGNSGRGSPRSVGGEGPMTPRNDVGPFVFDGGAGAGAARTGGRAGAGGGLVGMAALAEVAMGGGPRDTARI